MGLLFDSVVTGAEDAKPSLVFTCRGPDTVKVVPFAHPSLTHARPRGQRRRERRARRGYSEANAERRRIELKLEAMETSQEAQAERGPSYFGP